MKRFATLLAMILALTFGFGTTIAAADQGTTLADLVNTEGPADGAQIALLAEPLVNEFLAEHGQAPVTMVYVAFDEVIDTPCGEMTSRYAYMYCITSDSSYIGLAQAQYFNEGTHKMSSAVLVAHEAGHNLQARLNSNPFTGQSHEDGADCVGGAWLKWAKERLHLNITIFDLPGFFNLVMKIENHNPAYAHGTWLERGGAMVAGYTGGLTACNQYMPVV